jgi:cell division protein FtsQ
VRSVAGIVIVAAVFAGWMFSPLAKALRITHVEVSGASQVSDLDVRRAVDPALSGANLINLDTSAIVQRLEQLPFVRGVEIDRNFPNGVEIRVSEYAPLALGAADGTWWLLSKNGRVLAQARVGEWRGRIPLVQLTSENVELGDRVGDEPALQVLRLRPANSTLAISEVELNGDSLTATLVDDTEIRFGRPDRLELKLGAVDVVRRYAARKRLKLAYIDASVWQRPALCEAGRACANAPSIEQRAQQADIEKARDAARKRAEQQGAQAQNANLSGNA